MKKFYKVLEEKLSSALKIAGYNVDEVVVNESNRPDLGQYQFNGAMALAKAYSKSPIEIAKDIIVELKKDVFFEDVNIAGPGFINMTISDNALVEFTNIEDYKYEKNDKLIFLDYGGANVAKSLHVGHLRSANIGEALKRLCNYLGYKTISDTHLGDWGRPLGLVILELSKRNPDWVYFDESYSGEYPDVEITNELLEEIYPYASSKAKEDEVYLKEAQVMTKKLQDGERGILALWYKIMEVSKTDIKKIYDRLNAEFDLYKGESDAERYVPEMLEYLSGLNIVVESEGAKVIEVSEDTDKLEIPPMLLIKSGGGILYSTTELATIYDRMKNYKPDEIWYIVDKRQDMHFTQVFRCAKKTNIIDSNTRLTFIGFGTMNGSDGKPFKTRDGGVMRLENLMKEIEELVANRLENQRSNMEKLMQQKSILQSHFKFESIEAKKKAEELGKKAKNLEDLLAKLETEKQNKLKKMADAATKQKPILSVPTLPSVKGAFQKSLGSLPLPARGKIVQRYGDATLGGGNAKGLTMDTRPNAQVISPFDGTVLFAGEFKGYGNLIIIEHEDNYHSLLSGLNRIDCTVGQTVLTGEPVGIMSNQQTNKLYMEFRQNGKPVNPASWFASKI